MLENQEDESGETVVCAIHGNHPCGVKQTYLDQNAGACAYSK